MHVVFVTPEMDDGGPAAVVFELASQFVQLGIETSAITFRRGGRFFDQLPKNGVSVVSVESRFFQTRLARRYPAHMLIPELLRMRPDAVLATQAVLPLMALPRSSRIALVHRPANVVSTYLAQVAVRAPVKARVVGWLESRGLNRADAIVAQSCDIAKDLRILGIRPPITVIPNPVPHWRNAVVATAIEQSDQVAQGRRPWIVSVGRLSPQKGYDVLVNAFVDVLIEHPRALLTILGEGPEREDLERRVNSLGLSGSVQLPGHLADPWSAVRGADVFVSSSRHEGFPNVLLEALASGLPVVATDCPGGSREIVREGFNGYLVAAGDSGAVSSRILSVLHRAQPISLADAYARVRDVEERFGIDSVANRYLAVIETALASVKQR